MPVTVTCLCGQRFSAKDQLYGKQVKCPACGGPLQVPAPISAAAAATPATRATTATPSPPRPAAAPAPKKPAPAAAASKPGVKVACACGQAFVAPETMRGKSARCPTCGGTIKVPPAAQPADSMTAVGGDLMNVDPLMMGNDPFSAAASSPLGDPLAAKPKPAAAVAAPASAAANKSPWLLIGLGGGAAAVVLIIVIAVVVSNMGGNDVAQVPIDPGPLSMPGTAGGPASPPGASTPLAPTSPTGSPVTPGTGTGSSDSSGSPSGAFGTGAPADNTGGNTATPASGTTTPSNLGTSTPASTSSSASPAATSGSPPAGATGIRLLPSAIQTWHADDRFRRRGVIRVGDAETHYGHYSWMTQLLPFLGHQKEYDQFNFNQGLTDGKNFEVGVNVIPAFLNPLDNRQKWKGYPLQGLALTHFVGMAGIEDTRNLVAGSLPRTDPRAGVFGYDDVATPEQITDGTSQTIMVIGSGTMANPWIMGGGATIRGAREPYFDKVSGFGSRNLPQAGGLAVMADGSVRFVSASVEPSVFRSMCTIHGADSVDLERAAAPFLLESIAK